MITDIRLQNFRSYKDEAFEIGPGVNIIVGPNASGKTNLLEAIMVVSLGYSYRAKDNELVRFNAPWARLDAHLKDGIRTVKLQAADNRVKKSFLVSNQEFQRLTFHRTLPLVLFEPGDLYIINGNPERRRDYVDRLLSQTVESYATLLRQYKRTLSQRNALLKKGLSVAKKQIFAWDVRLSELGGQIAEHRYSLVEAFNKKATPLYRQLSGGKEKIELVYMSSLPPNNYGSQLLHKLQGSLEQDCERGFTTYGPHRDDVGVFIRGHLAQESASRGETRTLLLVLKILELERLEQARGKRPLILLDDVFSELDGARRRALTSFLQNYQAFITTTDADVVIQHFMNKATIIPTSK